jgi:geranylgeranyl pyrophosphate synthase
MKIYKTIFKQKFVYRSFAIKRDYKNLTEFKPEEEIAKFYKNYFKTMTKEELENLKATKLEKINAILNKGNSFSAKVALAYNTVSTQSDMINIVSIINKISGSEEKNLQELSEYYFKQDGKRIRPYMLTLLSKYIYECKFRDTKENYFDSEIHNKYVKPFAACVEVLHNASLLQDDIIDNSDKRRNSLTAHNVFGIRNTVYGANYLISRCASLLAELDKGQLNEIYSLMVGNLTYGEVQQSLRVHNLHDIEKSFETYMIKTYYKTASLMALSCRGIGVIYDLDDTLQRELFNIGLHNGMVFQFIDDCLDVMYDSVKIKKPAFKDIEEGITNAYLLYEVYEGSRDIIEMAKRKYKGQGDIEAVKKIISNGTGVLKTFNVALDHLIEVFHIINDNPFFADNSSKYILFKYFNLLGNRTV